MKYVPYRSRYYRKVFNLKLVENYFPDGMSLSTRATVKGQQVIDALRNFKPTVKHCRKCKHRVECLVHTDCKRSLMVIDI